MYILDNEENVLLLPIIADDFIDTWIGLEISGSNLIVVLKILEKIDFEIEQL